MKDNLAAKKKKWHARVEEKQHESLYRAKIDEEDKIINSFMNRVVAKAPSENQKLSKIRHLSKKLTKIMT